MIDFATTKAAAAGHWPEILQYLGVPGESLTGRHCPCPGCAGRDRFRWDNQKEAFFCGGGGDLRGGDGFSLLEHCGWTKSSTLHAVAQYLGLDRVMYSPEQRKEISKCTQAAKIAKIEAALSHEMTVLSMAVNARVTGRQLVVNRNFTEARPEWQPPPDDTWDRELIAARRIINGLEVRYGL